MKLFIMYAKFNLIISYLGLIKASSPDELALINFARLSGYEFQGVDENNNIVLNIMGVKEKFLLLQTLEFTSARSVSFLFP